KLQEVMRRGIRTPPAVNAGLLAIAVILAVIIEAGTHTQVLFWLILVTAGALGVFAVVPIGGADMPVVISTLNAFTGLSAAAAGIALDNTALIVAGMLVGASGSILTKQMAEAMNRSIANVFFAGVGTAGGAHRRRLADLRHADSRRRQVSLGHRPEALDVLRLRRHRQPAVLRPQDRDAVRGREVLGLRDPLRGPEPLGLIASAPAAARPE